MKINPTMIASIPLVFDRIIEEVCLHIFYDAEGNASIRIGDNLLVFDRNGEIQTVEARFRSRDPARTSPPERRGILGTRCLSCSPSGSP